MLAAPELTHLKSVVLLEVVKTFIAVFECKLYSNRYEQYLQQSIDQEKDAQEPSIKSEVDLLFKDQTTQTRCVAMELAILSTLVVGTDADTSQLYNDEKKGQIIKQSLHFVTCMASQSP